MSEGITIGENRTDDIFSGIDEITRGQFPTVLAKAKSNLIALEQEED